MSSTIDNRIVEMRFDNSNFEKNVAQTIKTTENLNKSLSFSGATKGFSDISAAANKVTLDPLMKGVTTVQASFSALQVVAITALSRITNSAIDVGLSVSKALTVDPIFTGLDEYETKLNSIQTILTNTASKGTTIDDVTKALDELNLYADKTIYNFAEMTRNIGTFTAAGIDLETSTVSIQGIANLAAASGSNAHQAANAMYQLSQALAAGSVKLQDWNSVVNSGMGGELFQKNLRETAAELAGDEYWILDTMNKIADGTIAFRETLKDGWVTTEVLNTTLKKFTKEGAAEYAQAMLESGQYTQEQADALIQQSINMEDAATKVKTFTQLWSVLKETAQSGWAKTWELLIGDFYEARNLFTDLSDVFGKIINESAESRNALLQNWSDFGGREELLRGFENILVAIGKIITPISDAFNSIFSGPTALELLELTRGFEDFTRGLIISDETAEKIGETFTWIFSVIKNGFGVVGDVSGKLIEDFSRLSSVVTEFVKNNTNLESIGDVFIFLQSSFSIFIETVSSGLDKLSSVGEILDYIKQKFDYFKEALSGITSSVINAIFPAMNSVDEVFEKFTGGTSSMDILKTGVFAVLTLAIAKFTKSLTKVTSSTGGVLSSFTKILTGLKPLEQIGKILEQVQGILKTYQESLKADILLKIAGAVAILTLSLISLAFIDTNALIKGVSALGALMLIMSKTLTSLSTVLSLKGSASFAILSAGLISFSLAILVLTGAIKSLSGINVQNLVQGLIALGAVLTVLYAFIKSTQNMTGPTISMSIALIALGAAINIFGIAIKSLGSMDIQSILKGFGTITAILLVIKLFMDDLSSPQKFLSMSIALIALGAAINIFGIAIKSLGSMDIQSILKGFGTITAILLVIKLFMDDLSSPQKFLSMSIALIALGAAINILGIAMKSLGSMDIQSILKGFGSITAILLVIKLFMDDLSKGGFMNMAGILLLSVAISIITNSFEDLSKLSFDEIARGTIALGASLLVLGIGLKLMSGTMTGSLSLLIASTALIALGAALKIVSSLSLTEIGLSLLALAGGIGILAGAALLLTPVIPSMLLMSAAILAFGAATALVGVGVLALGVGLSALAISAVAGVAAIIQAVETFLNGIITLHPLIVKAATALVLGISVVIIEAAPTIGEALLVLIEVFVSFIAKGVPIIGLALIQLLIGLADVISANIQPLIDSGTQLLLAILHGISTAITIHGPEVVKAVLSIIGAIGSVFSSSLPLVAEMGVQLISGFIQGIWSTLETVTSSVGDFFDSVLAKIREVLGINSPSDVLDGYGVNSGEGYVQGTDRMKPAAETAGAELGLSTIDGLSTQNNEFGATGDSAGNEYLSGLEGVTSDGFNIGSLLGSSSLEGVKDQNGSFNQAGSMAGDNFLSGLTNTSAVTTTSPLVDDSLTSLTAAQPQFTQAGTDSMISYGTGITNAQSSLITTVNTVITNLIDHMSFTHSDLFATVGTSYMNSIITGMQSSTTVGVELSNSLLEIFTNAMLTISPSIYIRAQLLTESIISGLNFKRYSITIAVNGIMELILTNINSFQQRFLSTGQFIMTQFVAGIKSNNSNIVDGFTQQISSALSSLRGFADDFKSAGVDLGKGFVDGIESQEDDAYDAGYDLGRQASRGLDSAIDRNSPSKVARASGSDFGLGFGLGIFDKLAYIASSGDILAKTLTNSISTALTSVQDLIDNEMVYEPVIRPLIDTRNLSAINSINAGFNLDQAGRISATLNSQSDSQIQNGSEDVGLNNGTVVNFQQNNYSPKALSRTEIYRQTNNQLSLMKGAK